MKMNKKKRLPKQIMEYKPSGRRELVRPRGRWDERPKLCGQRRRKIN
jgi:hypothetical protein